MLIAFAGLPGTGKTTLATKVAQKLGGIVLNKDTLRAALFGPEDIEYSRQQDDFCMAILYQLARYHLRNKLDRPVLIDGRTFSQSYQVDDLRNCVARCNVPLKIIECVCSEATALQRIAHDQQKNAHLAADRDVALYHRVRATWQPIPEPKLVIATDKTDLNDAVTQVLAYVRS